MKELVKTLSSEFSDKDYAQTYVNELSNMEIATQIKVLREQRGLTQSQLAQLAGMKQERISALENVDNDSWTAKTLRKLADAFDVTLKISFEEFSNRIIEFDALENRGNFERQSREEDLSNFVQHYDNLNDGFVETYVWISSGTVEVPSMNAWSNSLVRQSRYRENDDTEKSTLPFLQHHE